MPKSFIIPAWNTLYPQGPVCVCVFVCVCLCATFSDRLYLSSPLPALNLPPSRRLFKQPLIIWVRFKVWTPSLCQQKLYTCSSFTESGEYPGADPPWQPQRWHTRPLDTVWGETLAGAPPPCSGALCLCRRLVTVSVHTLLHSQGSGSEQEVLNGHPWGFSDSLAHIYRMGSKGQRGFSSAGSAYICNTLVFPAAHHKCLDFFFSCWKVPLKHTHHMSNSPHVSPVVLLVYIRRFLMMYINKL